MFIYAMAAGCQTACGTDADACTWVCMTVSWLLKKVMKSWASRTSERHSLHVAVECLKQAAFRPKQCLRFAARLGKGILVTSGDTSAAAATSRQRQTQRGAVGTRLRCCFPRLRSIQPRRHVALALHRSRRSRDAKTQSLRRRQSLRQAEEAAGY